MADSKDMLKVIIDALQDKKAEDIRVIDISNVSVIADYSLLLVVVILTRFRLW